MTDLAVALAHIAETSTLQRHAPLCKFWFDKAPSRADIAEERRHRQEWLTVGVFD